MDWYLRRCRGFSHHNNLGGDLDLAPHGINRHKSTFKLLNAAKMIQEFWDGGDLVAFLRHTELRQCQLGIRRVSAERVQSLQALAPRACGAMSCHQWRSDRADRATNP